jgi:hypothetical protein
MLLDRMVSTEIHGSAVPGDIGCGQTVNDLGKGEERKLGGEYVGYRTEKHPMMLRMVIMK